MINLELIRLARIWITVYLTIGVSNLSAEEVRLVKESGVYHLPVRINDTIELKFVVDTGAADVLIPADVIITLARTGTITDSDFIGKGSYRTADGTITQNAKLNLRSLQVGSKIITNIVASVGPVEGTLLLGQSALEKLEPWRMETKRGIFMFGERSDIISKEKEQERPLVVRPFESGVIYFAAELPPTENIPPEAPLCYKFQVASPDEQLKKLKKKYPNLYDANLIINFDGSKNLVAKRRDEGGNVVSYFYSTSPVECNKYQKNQLGIENDKNNTNSKSNVLPIIEGNSWVFVANTKKGSFYFFPSSVEKEGDYVWVWQKTEFYVPEQVGVHNVKTQNHQFLYDCKHVRFKPNYFISYDFNGNILNSGDYDDMNNPWAEIVPKSIADMIFHAACRY